MFQMIANPRLVSRAALAGVLAASLALLAPAPLRAQSGDPMLEGRISNIERQLNQLQSQVSQGGSAPVDLSRGAGGTDGDLYQRVVTIEQTLRTLTGQVEQMGFQQRDLQARLERLEAGGAAASVAPGTSGPAAPEMAAPGSQTLGTLSAPSSNQMAAGDEDSQFAAAVDVLYRGDYAGGTQALQSFVQQHPKSKKTGEAYYWLGESQLAQKSYREAAEAFLQVVQNYPKDAKAPQSLVKLGVTLIAAGEKKEGCNQLKSVKEVFPKVNQSILDMATRERSKAGC